MDCRSIRELLSDYIDRDLSEPDRGAVQAHLRGCPGCRSEHRALLLAVQLVHSLPEIQAPPNFRSALSRRIAEREQAPWWKKAAAFLDRGLSALPLRSMTAAAGVVLVITIFAVSHDWTGPKSPGLAHDDTAPAILASGTDPVPAEFASTGASPAGAEGDAPYFNTPTEFLMDIVKNDPAWNVHAIYPHSRGAGVIINTPQYVVEVMMDPAEFLIIQSIIEEQGLAMPTSLREARSLFPIYVRFLPSPTAPLGPEN